MAFLPANMEEATKTKYRLMLNIIKQKSALNIEEFKLIHSITFPKFDHFIQNYLWKNTPAAIIYFVTLAFFTFIALYTAVRVYCHDESSVASIIIYISAGIFAGFLSIPLHELFHYFAYKVIGAKQVSIHIKFMKLKFWTTADQFPIEGKQMIFIALLPFILITLMVFITLPFIELTFTISLLSFLSFHTHLCSSDFALASYIQNQSKAITVIVAKIQSGILEIYQKPKNRL